MNFRNEMNRERELKDYFSRKIMEKKNSKIEEIIYLLNIWRE